MMKTIGRFSSGRDFLKSLCVSSFMKIKPHRWLIAIALTLISRVAFAEDYLSGTFQEVEDNVGPDSTLIHVVYAIAFIGGCIWFAIKRDFISCLSIPGLPLAVNMLWPAIVSM